ncbi:unnamed protein product [Gongylonema pulchrum]|uniref:BED-type domain-containing protein n=1 Tax=Gongylonema pulchrum TaxID=637853 RepID=A0A183EC35_9BILA|nr:unnamed protein product [Gongylonema pulchrum]
MDASPSTDDSSVNLEATVNACNPAEEVAPAILSSSGTWLRLSMPYFPKKSNVWRYFDLYESDGYSRADTERVVKCRLLTCLRKELRLDAQSSTKGMWEHIRNKHPEIKCDNGSTAPQDECTLLLLLRFDSANRLRARIVFISCYDSPNT